MDVTHISNASEFAETSLQSRLDRTFERGEPGHQRRCMSLPFRCSWLPRCRLAITTRQELPGVDEFRGLSPISNADNFSAADFQPVLDTSTAELVKSFLMKLRAIVELEHT